MNASEKATRLLRLLDDVETVRGSLHILTNVGIAVAGYRVTLFDEAVDALNRIQKYLTLSDQTASEESR